MTIIDDYDWDRLSGLYPNDFIEKMKNDPCWKGYAMLGQKKKGGKTVPNCVKTSNHKEGDIATAKMTPNFLPKEPIPGGGDVKNPEMGEQKVRMPRMETLKKLQSKNALPMMAAGNDSNYSEFESEENNGGMIVNQLRVIREKTDILLGMLDGTDNLPPWCFVKITNAGTGLASVADYLRYGAES
jgi:hypothetical protein